MPPLAYLGRSTQLLVELESEGNPMASTLVRGAIAARNGDLVIEVQWRMLHAAIQHRLVDPLAPGKFQDPAGAGPFTMRRVVLAWIGDSRSNPLCWCADSKRPWYSSNAPAHRSSLADPEPGNSWPTSRGLSRSLTRAAHSFEARITP